MKIGIFTALFNDKSLTETLDLCKEEGLQAVEFGCGALIVATRTSTVRSC